MPPTWSESQKHPGGRKSWYYECTDAFVALALRLPFLKHLRDAATPVSDFEAASAIFGELVSNVVQHAPGAISIEVNWASDGRARLQICDTGPVFAYVPRLPDPACESGRGLFVVTSLGEAMEIAPHQCGACVTIALPIWSKRGYQLPTAASPASAANQSAVTW